MLTAVSILLGIVFSHISSLKLSVIPVFNILPRGQKLTTNVISGYAEEHSLKNKP
jgi:hypothetical protein